MPYQKYRVTLTREPWGDPFRVIGATSNFAVFETVVVSEDGSEMTVRLDFVRSLDGFAQGDETSVSLLTDSERMPSIEVPVSWASAEQERAK